MQVAYSKYVAYKVFRYLNSLAVGYTRYSFVIKVRSRQLVGYGAITC